MCADIAQRATLSAKLRRRAKHLTMITDPLFYAAAVPAVILLGLAKGGFSGIGVLAVPLMTLVVSPVQAASITLPILIVQDAVSVWVFRREWDGRSLAVLIPSSLVGIGARLCARRARFVGGGGARCWADFAGVRRAPVVDHLGAEWSGRTSPRMWSVQSGARRRASPSQIAHAGGVPFQIYMLPKRLERDVLIGTSAIFFAAMNWMKVPAYAALGQFTRANMATSLALFPLAVASTIVGTKLIRRVSPDRFYKLIYVLLILTGLKLTWDGAVGELQRRLISGA